MWTLLAMAWRNVRRNKRRTAITLAAMVVGIGAVISIRGILNGLQAGIIKASAEGGLGALQVHRVGYLDNILSTPLSLDFPVEESLLNKVRAVKGVRAVAPRIQFAGSITKSVPPEEEMPEALFFTAVAVDPVLELQVCPMRPDLYVEGTRFDETHLVMGSALAASLAAKVDDEAVLLAPDKDGSLNGEVARVGGAMHAMLPGEPKVAVVPLGLAQRLLRMEGRATELAVAVDDLRDIDEVKVRLAQALGPEWEVHSWLEVVPERKLIMRLQDGISAIVSVVFLVLMLLGVANTTLMAVLERTREVGTMLSLGLTRAQVMALFLLEALVLGVLGAAGGLLLSSAFVARFSQGGLQFRAPSATKPFDVLPFLTPRFTLVVLAVAVVGAVVFALYPARRASRLRPVEALAGR
ncbi:MAG: FtsX-like permease family protein [Myxococcota bacterium]